MNLLQARPAHPPAAVQHAPKCCRPVLHGAPRVHFNMSGLSASANARFSNGEQTLGGAYPGRTDTAADKLRSSLDNTVFAQICERYLDKEDLSEQEKDRLLAYIQDLTSTPIQDLVVGKEAIGRILPPQLMQQAVTEEWFCNSKNPAVIKWVQIIQQHWGVTKEVWAEKVAAAKAQGSNVLLERPRDFLPPAVVEALQELWKLARAAAVKFYGKSHKRSERVAARQKAAAAFEGMEWDYTSAPELVRNLGGLVETWVQSTTALQARLVLAAQNHALDLVIEGKVAQSVLLPTLPGGHHGRLQYSMGYCVVPGPLCMVRKLVKAGMCILSFDYDLHEGNSIFENLDVLRELLPGIKLEEYLCPTDVSHLGVCGFLGKKPNQRNKDPLAAQVDLAKPGYPGTPMEEAEQEEEEEEDSDDDEELVDQEYHQFNETEHLVAWSVGLSRAAEFVEKYAADAAAGKVLALFFAGGDILRGDKYSPDVGGTIKETLLYLHQCMSAMDIRQVFTLEGGYTALVLAELLPPVATLLATYQLTYMRFMSIICPKPNELKAKDIPAVCKRMCTPEFADMMVEEVVLLAKEGKTYSNWFPELLEKLRQVAKTAPLLEGRKARLLKGVVQLVNEVVNSRGGSRPITLPKAEYANMDGMFHILRTAAGTDNPIIQGKVNQFLSEYGEIQQLRLPQKGLPPLLDSLSELDSWLSERVWAAGRAVKTAARAAGSSWWDPPQAAADDGAHQPQQQQELLAEWGLGDGAAAAAGGGDAGPQHPQQHEQQQAVAGVGGGFAAVAARGVADEAGARQHQHEQDEEEQQQAAAAAGVVMVPPPQQQDQQDDEGSSSDEEAAVAADAAGGGGKRPPSATPLSKEKLRGAKVNRWAEVESSEEEDDDEEGEEEGSSSEEEGGGQPPAGGQPFQPPTFGVSGLLDIIQLNPGQASAMSVDAAPGAGGEAAEAGADDPAPAAGPADLAAAVAGALNPCVVEAVWAGVLRGDSHEQLLRVATDTLRQALDPGERVWVPHADNIAAGAGALLPEVRQAIQQALDTNLLHCKAVALTKRGAAHWEVPHGAMLAAALTWAVSCLSMLLEPQGPV